MTDSASSPYTRPEQLVDLLGRLVLELGERLRLGDGKLLQRRERARSRSFRVARAADEDEAVVGLVPVLRSWSCS
jgi:hypothetical protein